MDTVTSKSNAVTSNAVTPNALLSIKNKRWLNLIRRLEQLAMSQNGHCILYVVAIADKDGNPLAWLTPEMKLIEPKDGSQAFLDILKGL